MLNSTELYTDKATTFLHMSCDAGKDSVEFTVIKVVINSFVIVKIKRWYGRYVVAMKHSGLMLKIR